MDIKDALAQVLDGNNLSSTDMQAVMQQIMTGGATPAQIGGFLIALRCKGETVDEIAAAAQVMRALASPVTAADEHLVDTCGTGGDGANLFNVSTASAFVVAAAGGQVAKHGNRSVSSSTGSADLLEAAGINLQLSPEQVGRAIEEIGVGFLFAPAHHSAMKHAIGPRKEMGVRTVFNVLGPLTNPAGVKKQVIGVFSAAWCEPLARVLQQLGSTHVLVVHSNDGLDELSLAAPSTVSELKDGTVRSYEIKPDDLGLNTQSLDGLSVGSAEESLALIKKALDNPQDDIGKKARDMIALNAGAAIYAADLSLSLAQGVEQALDALGSGMALAKLEEYASFSRVFQDQ